MKFGDTHLYKLMSSLDEDAKSKVQRRLFAMALAHKRGKLSGEYVSDTIKKLSKLSVETLEGFAKTKEKKRKKDGTISKRNAIPYRVKKTK